MESDALNESRRVHRRTFQRSTETGRDGTDSRLQSRRHRRRVTAMIRTVARRRPAVVRLGLRENAAQFALLVVVNAFVGAMVGMERSILPLLAVREFQLTATFAALSFIVVFGVTKALTNYAAGQLSDRIGRKSVLVAGWI